MAARPGSSSCELPIRGRGKPSKNRIYRFRKDFSWKGIRTERYKPEDNDWANISRQVLIGNHGEDTRFHVRYFEIEPGGYSSFEKHKHVHVVICIRGRGKVRLDRRHITLDYLDMLYIRPDAPHRLSNPFDEPFGFLCIVNSKRDRPVILEG